MSNTTENSGIVEPYELEFETITMTQTNTEGPGSETEPEPEPEPRPISSPSEIDLSGYQYDIVPTYKMIEDQDDQDTLFRIQFLQAFGITSDEYHPEIVSAVINDLYERYKDHTGIRGILELHPLYDSGMVVDSYSGDMNDDNEEDNDETPSLSPSPPPPHGRRFVSKENNSEMIFCMMFSFHLFDLFHACLRHAKHGEEIPQNLRDEIIEYLGTTF
jgi:hypothetical protein